MRQFGSFQVIWKSLVWVENALGVQHGLDITHESHSLPGFTVVDIVPLLQAQSVLCTDAALTAGRPLVDKGLDGSEKSRVFGRRGDVQVEVSISLKYRWKEMKGQFAARRV